MEAWMEMELIRLAWLEAEVRATRRVLVVTILVVLMFLLATWGIVARLLGLT